MPPLAVVKESPAGGRKKPVQIVLRMPKSLHRQLREAAAIDGVSMNQFICYALATCCAAAEPIAPQEVSV
jgi:predicted HicB family RNase H-like nuclease